MIDVKNIVLFQIPLDPHCSKCGKREEIGMYYSTDGKYCEENHTRRLHMCNNCLTTELSKFDNKRSNHE
ncbi:hypothetical protein J2755_000282 [Methanohalophilus levihalophilus]|uniref:hypothetical protein n=1 Tax=Methanohalophilus levihalophilus TaxID=1431282 RepID=UPI001AE57D1F|nr:hypothetical protein [Methanohalophilus levihalophilus]MBP2029362.1 hypothetical protein [Methanohalophilus levihalophilus]